MQPIIDRRTARLLLTRFTTSDAPAVKAMHQNSAVMATLGSLRSAAETERFVHDTIRHWADHGFGLWAVNSLESGVFMGRGGLRHVVVAGRAEVEVAYAFLPQFWGQGFATELARESVRVGFSELQLSELVAFTQVTNHSSKRVMEKAGFRYERGFERAGLPHLLFRLRALEWSGI